MAREQERRIRERAHALWEQEGKPHGRDQEHWFQAQRELDGGSKESKPKGRGRPAGAKAKSGAATTGDGSTAAKSRRAGDSGGSAVKPGKAGTAGGKKPRRAS
jgi:hypothetical protein